MSSVFDSEAFNARCFFPRDEVTPPPEGARDLRVPVDGAELHVRLHRSTGAPTLLLFHGNGEVVSDYDAVAPEFARVGFDLAVVDFRGYGASTGTPTLRTLLADAPRVLDAVAAEVTAPLVVMGRSLGSAAALELYGRNDARVAGVVLESGFLDLAGLVRRRGIRPPASFTDDELETFDGARKLQRGRAPLLVLHGAEDRAIAADEAREAHRLATTSVKHLVLVPGRGHNDVSASPVYWDAFAFVRAWATR